MNRIYKVTFSNGFETTVYYTAQQAVGLNMDRVKFDAFTQLKERNITNLGHFSLAEVAAKIPVRQRFETFFRRR